MKLCAWKFWVRLDTKFSSLVYIVGTGQILVLTSHISATKYFEVLHYGEGNTYSDIQKKTE
jgi:hypothetical protein